MTPDCFRHLDKPLQGWADFTNRWGVHGQLCLDFQYQTPKTGLSSPFGLNTCTFRHQVLGDGLTSPNWWGVEFCGSCVWTFDTKLQRPNCLHHLDYVHLVLGLDGLTQSPNVPLTLERDGYRMN